MQDCYEFMPMPRFPNSDAPIFVNISLGYDLVEMNAAISIDPANEVEAKLKIARTIRVLSGGLPAQQLAKFRDRMRPRKPAKKKGYRPKRKKDNNGSHNKD